MEERQERRERQKKICAALATLHAPLNPLGQYYFCPLDFSIGPILRCAASYKMDFRALRCTSQKMSRELGLRNKKKERKKAEIKKIKGG